MHVKLFSGQVLPSSDAPSDTKPASVDRRVMLVYAGKFISMDGEVEITPEHIEALAAAHNQRVTAVAAGANGGEPDIRSYPPIQLDHSASARDTVGRLVGPVEIGTFEHEGNTVPALYGTMRVLGAENVERVLDGRWSHVSIGADLETPKLTELSVTPFPAAENARMLSKEKIVERKVSLKAKGAPGGEVVSLAQGAREYEYRKFTYYIQLDDNGTYSTAMQWDSAEWYDKKGGFKTEAAAVDYIKKKIDEEIRRWPNEYLSARLSEGSEMDKEKLKKHLMEKKQMSAEDADKHLAALDDEKTAALAAEVDEDEKKLAAEAAEKEEKKKSEKKEKELAARREKIVQLKAGFAASAKTVQLRKNTARLHVALAKLRSERKVTPAEIKKLDIAKLAAGPSEALDAVLEAFQNREPVIIAGAFGSTAAEAVTKVRKQAKMTALEAETRAQLSSLPKRDAKLAEGEEGAADSVVIHVDQDPHTDLAAMEGEYGAICQMMDEGKLPEAKERMKQWMRKVGASDSSSDVNHTESLAKEVDELASTVAHMQTSFDELVTLADASVGDSQ